MSTSESWRNPRPAPELTGLGSRIPPRSLFPDWLRAWWPALLWAAMIFVASTDFFSSEHTSRIIEPILRWFLPGDQCGIARLHSPHHSQVRAFRGVLHFLFVSLSRAARNAPRMAPDVGGAGLVHRRRLFRTGRNSPVFCGFARRQPVGFASGFRQRAGCGRGGVPLLPLASSHK